MQFRQTGLAPKRLLIPIVCVIWLGSAVGGFALLALHENSPGQSAAAPSQWPRESRIEQSDGVATLVMFAHPHCPCTRASLEELSKTVSLYPEQANVSVVFLQPNDADDDWFDTDQVASAKALPGVHVFQDLDCAETRRFGAATSGQALLYDRNGVLQFNGGMTSSRGHAGDNAGRSAIEQLLSGTLSDLHEWPVFGCPLFDVAEGNNSPELD